MVWVPETHLFSCAGCDELVRAADPVCPHCGVSRSRAERTGPLAALAAALVVSACTTGQPAYGGPDTDSEGTEVTQTDATTTDTATTGATTTDATGTTAPTTGTGSAATTDDTTG